MKSYSRNTEERHFWFFLWGGIFGLRAQCGASSKTRVTFSHLAEKSEQATFCFRQIIVACQDMEVQNVHCVIDPDDQVSGAKQHKNTFLEKSWDMGNLLEHFRPRVRLRVLPSVPLDGELTR